MKKLVTLALAMIIAFSIVACCDNTVNSSVTSNTVETSLPTTSIQAEQSELSSSTIVGQIIDSVTYCIIDCNGKPVVNAEVVIDQQKGFDGSASGFTNAQGEVTFDDIDSAEANQVGEHKMKIRQYTLDGVRAIEKFFFELEESAISEVVIINIQSTSTYEEILNAPNRVEIIVVDEKNIPMENVYTSWGHAIPSIGHSIPFSHDEFDKDKNTLFHGYTNKDGIIAFVGSKKDELYSVFCKIDLSIKSLEFHLPDGTIEVVDGKKNGEIYYCVSPDISLKNLNGIIKIKVTAISSEK